MKSKLLLLIIFVFPNTIEVWAQENKDVGGKLTVKLRSQVKTDSGHFSFQIEQQEWENDETAIIVCDFWDLHHCLNAVRRMKEFGPRLNQVVGKAREQGFTVIHSPSDCMDYYKKHPARLRSINVPRVELPADVSSWCSQVKAEGEGVYPIDQSDGGEDDDPVEHAKWASELEAKGRNPNMPWKKQNDMIPIDVDSDFISDDGGEVWSILKSRGIKNVILVGVHTNMCVLGRPFGLRQMKRLGFNVALMRDMTDSMYNPKRWPYVSHYAGNDKVISYIEKFVCPTISSDQIIGGAEFEFKSDKRPRLAILIGESEYKTELTLPKFAEDYLDDFKKIFILANTDERNDFPEMNRLSGADLMLISVRRRVLPSNQLKLVRAFEAAGKPIVGIRTASHAFHLRNQDSPNGLEDWKSFDRDVFGGNYTNHYGNQMKSRVQFSTASVRHPITRTRAVAAHVEENERAKPDDRDLKSFGQKGSLYKTSPLAEGAEVLLTGAVLGHPPEPVAWTFTRSNGGRSFYTSLGHPGDFENKEFLLMLRNSIYWGLKKGIPEEKKENRKTENARKYWRLINGLRIPDQKQALTYQFESSDSLKDLFALVAYRKVIRIPDSWKKEPGLRVRVPENVKFVWLDGIPLSFGQDEKGNFFQFASGQKLRNEVTWLVVGARFQEGKTDTREKTIQLELNSRTIPIEGNWEWVSSKSGFEEEAKVSLPAKFGGSPTVFADLRAAAKDQEQ